MGWRTFQSGDSWLNSPEESMFVHDHPRRHRHHRVGDDMELPVQEEASCALEA